MIDRPGADHLRPPARLRTTNEWEVVTTVARGVAGVYHAAAGPVGSRTLTEARG